MQERAGLRTTGAFIMSGLTGGHSVFHWFQQSFVVMLPEVQAAFSLSEIGVGAIIATRELSSGLVTLPGGLILDLLRRHWGLVLALCMAAFGLGWLLIGAVSLYPVLLIGTAIVAMAASLWHLPALASLSHHFPERRATALSLHGIGGSIGEAFGPIVTGVLLGVLTWRGVLGIYGAIPLFLMFLVFWAFRDIGRAGTADSQVASLREQIVFTRGLLRNRVLLGITVVEGLRGMAFLAFLTFLPLYLDDEVGVSTLVRGVYLGLLVAMGIVTTPILGYVSDRVGRKLVLVPALAVLSGLSLLLVPYGQGVTLGVLIGLLGLFIYSDQPILTAAALDIVGRGVATTTLGVLSFARFVLSASSPLIAGGLYQTMGIDTVFYYAAALFALSALVILALPMKAPGSEPV